MLHFYRAICINVSTYVYISLYMYVILLFGCWYLSCMKNYLNAVVLFCVEWECGIIMTMMVIMMLIKIKIIMFSFLFVDKQKSTSLRQRFSQKPSNNSQLDILIEGQMDGQTGKQTDRQMDERMFGRMKVSCCCCYLFDILWNFFLSCYGRWHVSWLLYWHDYIIEKLQNFPNILRLVGKRESPLQQYATKTLTGRMEGQICDWPTYTHKNFAFEWKPLPKRQHHHICKTMK